MKLATIRTASGSAAVRIEDDGAVDLGFPDLGALLRRNGWRAHAEAAAAIAGRLDLRCDVDGENRQHANTSDLLFQPADVIAYASQFTTVESGDLIATGTPGGVGAGREPRVLLRDGQKLVTTIEGLGQLSNCCVAERAEPR